MKWDLYDKNLNLVNKIISEEDYDKIDDGLYHLSINVWLFNSQKQVLLIKKVLDYSLRYPGCWTSINGNVESGKTSFETVEKVIYEKLGIKINDSKIVELGVDVRDPHHYIYNTFAVYCDIDIKSISFNEKIISKIKWIDKDEMINMINNGEIEMALVPRIEQYVLPLLK